jgi:hypothetical protein
MTASLTSDPLTLRAACTHDLPAIEALIARSARELSVGFYTEAQVASLLRHVFGADTQLVRDGTYYVMETASDGLAAVGGWSRRRTLYGGDRMKPADDPLLDPGREPARIRAFFVRPGWVGGCTTGAMPRPAPRDSTGWPWWPPCRASRSIGRSASRSTSDSRSRFRTASRCRWQA